MMWESKPIRRKTIILDSMQRCREIIYISQKIVSLTIEKKIDKS